MPGLSLFLTLVFAHLLMLAGRSVEFSPWTVPAYLWQDAALALGFGAFAHFARRPQIVWPLYALLVSYAALNAVVARVLPSPLTPAMLRAARGTLADSVAWYLSLPNLLACIGVVAVGAATPMVLRRLRMPDPRVLAALAVATIAIGPLAASRIDTEGRHRNAFSTLLPQGLPESEVPVPAGGWRQGSPDASVGMDLSAFRGTARGRNVVIVVLESTGARYLPPYGASEDPMPHFTRLAGQGLIFDSAYAVYPESIKGLYAVICSRHPGLDLAAEAHARAACDALPRRLEAADYSTALFHSGRFDYLGMREVVESSGFEHAADAGTLSGRENSSFGIDEETTVDAMLAWIDGREPDRPFFLVYLPIAGHHPYVTHSPGPYTPTDEYHRYLNVLHEADEALNRLLTGIAQRGLEGNTLFIIFGDHGEAFGQHPGNMGHSFFLYEENVRVPYLVAAPGLLSEPLRATQTISVVDTAPLLLDLLGLRIPDSYEGASALDGEERIAFLVTDYAQRWLGLIDDCWKMLMRVDDRSTELFDICADPLEERNLTSQHAERVADYSQRLSGWAQATRAGLLAEDL